jgi:hypothetical protein
VELNFGFEGVAQGTPVLYSSTDKVDTNHSGWWAALGFGFEGMPVGGKYIACHILNAKTDALTAANVKCWWSTFDTENFESYVMKTDGVAIAGTSATVSKVDADKTINASWNIYFDAPEVATANDYIDWAAYSGKSVKNSAAFGRVLGGTKIKYLTHENNGAYFEGKQKWSAAVQTTISAVLAILMTY